MRSVTFRLSDELGDRLDVSRGDVSRSKVIVAALELYLRRGQNPEKLAAIAKAGPGPVIKTKPPSEFVARARAVQSSEMIDRVVDYLSNGPKHRNKVMSWLGLSERDLVLAVSQSDEIEDRGGTLHYISP